MARSPIVQGEITIHPPGHTRSSVLDKSLQRRVGAIALPMVLEAPVTTATLLVNLFISEAGLSVAIEGPTPGSNISPTGLCLNKSSLGQFGFRVIPQTERGQRTFQSITTALCSDSPAVVIATRGRCFDTLMTKIRGQCLTKPVSCEQNGKFTIWPTACTEPQRNEKNRTSSRVP